MKTKFISALTLFLLFTSSYAQHYKRTLKETIYVTSDEKNIELHFPELANYTIYQGMNQNLVQWNNPISIYGKQITLTRGFDRPYFKVIMPNKDTLTVAERKLIINDLDNFRDLGGIKNTDGNYVIWGRFYRSDALNKLANNEFPFLDNLLINKVFDLRTDSEIAKAKDNLPQNITYEHFPIFTDQNGGLIQGLEQKLTKEKLTKKDAQNLMLDMYKSFVLDDSDKFNSLLHQIMIEDPQPSIFHCTAGKDRTGFTAAMILAILKVDKKTILDEYEMTNFYTADEINYLTKNVSALGYGDNIEPEAVRVMMSVDRKYLEASFDMIEKKFGGIDAFIKNQLGFSDAVRNKLIKKFTY